MKKNKTPLGIFTEAIGLYFSNFDKFFKYMTFPVLGQVLGLLLVLLLTMVYTNHVPQIENINILILLSILVTLPGLLIFTKAFWEYLVAYGSVNSMLQNMLKSGKVYDFDAHTELIKRRTIPYVGLWFLVGVFSLISVIPFFWIISAIVAVYCVLIFQVFTYEPELSPIGCVKRSLELVKGHFASTFMLIALVGALTYVLIPNIANKIFELSKVTSFVAGFISPFFAQLPIDELNNSLVQFNIQPLKIESLATFVITTTIAQILIQYTLPLRSILWALWYQSLNGSLAASPNLSKNKSKKVRKPSEKLMEESNKKYSSKKLDKNILKRAMEEDND